MCKNVLQKSVKRDDSAYDVYQISAIVCLPCDHRNGSVKAVFEMIVVSNYVSEYCVRLALRDGLQQLAEAGKLPFHIVDVNTTGIVVFGR